MAKITAIGIFRGKRITVTVTETDEGLQVDFDGVEFEPYEDEFRQALKSTPPMGGTYFPPIDSMLNALNVLTCNFFDGKTYSDRQPKKINVEGDIGTIPTVDDIPDIVY